MNTDLPQDMIVAPRRWRWFYFFALGGVSALAPLVFDGSDTHNYLLIGFGLFFIVGSAAMMPVSAFALRLHHDGFDYWVAYRKFSVDWDQVHFIRSFTPYRWESRVGWNYYSEDDEFLKEIGLFAGVPSVEGSLPIDYCISADELAELMSRFQERASPPSPQ